MCNIIEELPNDIEEISDNDYWTTLVSSFLKCFTRTKNDAFSRSHLLKMYYNMDY